MKRIQSYYEDFSHRYDTQRNNPYFRFIEELELNILSQYVRPIKGRLLELGCGTGIFLKHMQSPGLSLHGLDYTWGMLKQTKHKLDGSNVALVQGDGQALPYADSSFDIVYSFKVLAHMSHVDWALNEIRRVLCSKGTAILEFYNCYSIRYLLHRDTYFHQWQSTNRVRQQVEKAGFSIINTYGVRIVTPFAYALEIPVISDVLRYLEKHLSPTALNRFAGYYVVVCRSSSG
ncbi:class I SAM-dependent methyltransferase [Thermodesulfobacteriota bacterium]